MSWLLSFLCCSLAFWGLVEKVVGCPGMLKGPWPLERMAHLKSQEMTIYWLAVWGIPFSSLLLFRFLKTFRADSASPVPVVVEYSNPPRTHPLLWIVLGVLMPAWLYFVIPRQSVNAVLQFSDEGLRLAAAAQAEQGRVPYRQIYFQYGPGSEILEPRLAFHFWGRTLSGYRHFVWFIEPLGVLAAYFLGLVTFRRKGWVLFLAVILTVRLEAWIHLRAALPLLAFASLACAWQSAGKTQRLLLWTSGVLCAVGVFYSLESGVLSFATVSVWYGISAALNRSDHKARSLLRQEFGFYLWGGAFIFALAFMGLAWRHAVPAFFQNVFFIGRNFLPAWGKPTPVLCSTLISFLRSPLILYHWQGAWVRWWFPVLLYISVLSWALVYGRLSRFSDRMFLLLALSGVFFFTVAMGRSDFDHWVKGNFSLWILVLAVMDVALDRLLAELRRPAPMKHGGNIVWTSFLLVAFARYGWGFMNASDIYQQMRAISMPPGMTNRPLPETLKRIGPIELAAEERQHVQGMVSRIWKYVPPQGSLYIFGDEALYYFLADRHNPTRYGMSSIVVGDRVIQEVIEDLRHGQPSCIVVKEDFLTLRPDLSPIYDFIASHYYSTEHWGGYYFMVPAARALGRPDPNH